MVFGRLRESEWKGNATMTVKENREIKTPSSVETRLGNLQYEWGYPSAETTRKSA